MIQLSHPWAYIQKRPKKSDIYIYTHTHTHTHTHTGILFSHKNNEILSPAATWTDSENLIQNRNRLTTRKPAYCYQRGKE